MRNRDVMVNTVWDLGQICFSLRAITKTKKSNLHSGLSYESSIKKKVRLTKCSKIL